MAPVTAFTVRLLLANTNTPLVSCNVQAFVLPVGIEMALCSVTVLFDEEVLLI